MVDLPPVAQYFLFFLVYAFLGWVLEVIYVTVRTGHPTNRGFLAGCYCPIYGFGAVDILLGTQSWTTNAVAIFVASSLVGSALELVGGWALEKLFHRRWWDYSSDPFNIGGYICLRFSLIWGVVGLLFVLVIHPAVLDFLNWLPPMLVVVVTGVWGVAMVIDLAATVSSELGFNEKLRALQEASDLMNKQSEAISHGLGTAALGADHAAIEAREHVTEKRTEAQEHLAEQRSELHEHVSERRTEVQDRVALQRAEAQERLARLRKDLDATRRRHLLAYPELTSKAYPDALELYRQAAHSKADEPDPDKVALGK